MRWLGYFFIFMGIKMATDGVLRGLGIMRPFLIANMVNLAIRLSVALICAPRLALTLSGLLCLQAGLPTFWFLCGAQKILAGRESVYISNIFIILEIVLEICHH